MNRKNQAYDYLKTAIINNEFPPGTPLKEMELSKLLNMSRSPIREALRELEVEGMVESFPARGTVVTLLTPYDVEEIYELRVLHELWALEKGFRRHNSSELDKLTQDFTLAYEQKDWEKLHEADLSLHSAIIEKSGSRRLVSFVTSLNTQIERVRRYSARDIDRISRSYEEHMRIIDLIRKQDLECAKNALREHLRSVADSAIEAAKIMDIQSYKN